MWGLTLASTGERNGGGESSARRISHEVSAGTSLHGLPSALRQL